LFTGEFCFHVDFANGCARVWKRRIERFHLEHIIPHDSYGGGNVRIGGGGKSGQYGKPNLPKVNGTPNSQPYCEAMVPFLN
jgi:hypothetical protein